MEAQTIKGPYIPRRIRRNPVPHLPRYFKTMLWKDLKERLEKAKHICFIIVQNGEVNNVYIKTIENGQRDQKVHAGNDQGLQPVPARPEPTDQREDRQSDPKAEEALHQNLEDPPAAKTLQRDDSVPDDEIPSEETLDLPPEASRTPAIAPNLVTKPNEIHIRPDRSPPAPGLAKLGEKETLPALPEAPSKDQVPEPPYGPPKASSPPKEEETEVVPGHRVKAIYQNQEVKGTISKVLKEPGQEEEFIVILDSGRKVVMSEQKDGMGDGLLVLLTPEK